MTTSLDGPPRRTDRRAQLTEPGMHPAELAHRPPGVGPGRTAEPASIRDTPGVESVPATNGITRSAWFRTSFRSTITWPKWYSIGLVLVDFIATAAAGLTAILGVPLFAIGFAEQLKGSAAPYYVIGCLVLPLAWLAVLWGYGAYDRRYLGIGTEEFKRIIRASLVVLATVSLIVMSIKLDPSRGAVATALLAALVYLVAARYTARKVLHWRRSKGSCSHRVLLVGTLPESMEVFTALTRTSYAGMVPVGIYLVEGLGAARGENPPVPVYANRDIVGLVREIAADTIAVCGAASSEPGELRRLAWQLEGTGIDLVVAPQLTDIAGPRVHIRPVEGLPLLHVEEPTLSGVAWLTKNLIDRAAAAFGLLLLSPILAAVAIAIKVTSPGPAFFRQARVGREGTKFRVWKFRTMYLDAEERLGQLVDQNEADGLLFKIKDDPRVTPIGQFLRRTSIDELPQLINVLLGDMSLVGPRPLPAEDGDFLGDVRRRLLVRPGITGPWQVSGRSDLSWDDAVRLDLYYVDNWSLTYDFTILWRTISVVLARKGAY